MNARSLPSAQPSTNARPGLRRHAVTALAASACLLVPAWQAQADPTDAGPATAASAQAAPDVDVAEVQAHLQQLEQLAEANGGHRRAGSPGYEASVSYVEAKLKAAGYDVRRQACSSSCTYPSDNLIADWPGGDANHTVVFGAHLDGVSSGPGINDNGSGSMAQLQAALELAEANPEMAGHVRFAWWTDEEQGLNGSRHYVNTLSATERAQIQAYYNFDMVASPNGGYFINHVDSAVASPLADYYASVGINPAENAEGAGRSDDYSFQMAGIPTSGVAAGASDTKTQAEADAWGGTAGESFDSCYHSPCDTYPANVNAVVLDHASDAIAYTVWDQAVTSSVTYAPVRKRVAGLLAGVPLG